MNVLFIIKKRVFVTTILDFKEAFEWETFTKNWKSYFFYMLSLF